jgi:hypothetical protein
MDAYRYSERAQAIIDADAATVFEFLDDQANLSAHMSQSSGMMLGSRMNIHMEPDHTRRVGSRFGFTGRIFGVPLVVREVVTGRIPPSTKTWETVREPQLWVIGKYQMGFELEDSGPSQSTLTVLINYQLPTSWMPRLLGLLFGRAYARWCTRRMAEDARAHFAHPVAVAAGTRPLQTSG